jgi:DNA-binding response OmpR family regulator
VRIGGLRIDRARHTVEVDGRPVELTRLEFDMLAHLAAHPGRVVSRKELLREVWQRTDSARTVDVHLSWLRRKLGDDPEDPRFLHVHRGVGILLEDGQQPSTGNDGSAHG